MRHFPAGMFSANWRSTTARHHPSALACAPLCDRSTQAPLLLLSLYTARYHRAARPSAACSRLPPQVMSSVLLLIAARTAQASIWPVPTYTRCSHAPRLVRAASVLNALIQEVANFTWLLLLHQRCRQVMLPTPTLPNHQNSRFGLHQTPPSR